MALSDITDDPNDDTLTGGDGNDTLDDSGSLAVGLPTPVSDASSGALRSLLEQRIQDLKATRPDPANRWLSLAAALGQPTRTGSIGETLGNVASSLAESKGTEAADKAKRDDLILKYSIAQQGLDAKANAPAKIGKPPIGYRLAADGKSLEFIPGGPADPAVLAGKHSAITGVDTSMYDPSLSGSDLMDAMNPADKAQVQAMLDGRLLPPTSGTRSKEGLRLLELANRVDPTFDAGVAKTKFKTRADYAPGGSVGKNIASFNTAISHIGDLDKAVDGLGNYSGMLTLANPAKNLINTYGGKPEIRTFQTARNAVAEELTRAFRQSGGSVSEVDNWKNSFDAADSPEQLHAAVAEATNLLAGRVDQLVSPYNQVMGQNRTFLSWMPEKTRKTFLKLNPDYQVTQDDLDYLKNPSGSAFTTPVVPKGPVTSIPGAGPATTAPPPPAAVLEQYNRVPAANRATAKRRLLEAGYSVSGLD